MNLPLSAISATVAAAKVAMGAAARIGDAIGFDELLHGEPDAPQDVDNKTAIEQTTARLKSAITDTLSMLGMLDPHGFGMPGSGLSDTANPGHDIQVHISGEPSDPHVQLVGNHPHAARIEAALGADIEVQQLAGEILKVADGATVSVDIDPSVDLTFSPTTVNINGSSRNGPFGGYANWLAD